MAGNRAAAEKEIITWIEKLLPGSPNTEIYKQRFKSMSDKEFDEFMNQLENEEVILSIIAPNLNEHQLTVENNFKVAKELGHNFFERIWMDEGNEVPPYLTNHEYLVIDLPLRRQAQFLQKKISIPASNNVIDNLTGQPTGPSKGSKISYPEGQVLAAIGLDNCIVEMIKYRGGDLKGFNAMNSAINSTGGVDMTQLDKLGSKVKSTTTLRSYLFSLHLNNTLTD